MASVWPIAAPISCPISSSKYGKCHFSGDSMTPSSDTNSDAMTLLMSTSFVRFCKRSHVHVSATVGAPVTGRARRPRPTADRSSRRAKPSWSSPYRGHDTKMGIPHANDLSIGPPVEEGFELVERGGESGFGFGSEEPFGDADLVDRHLGLVPDHGEGYRRGDPRVGFGKHDPAGFVDLDVLAAVGVLGTVGSYHCQLKAASWTDVHGDGLGRHGDVGSTPERREMLGLGKGLPDEIPGSVDHARDGELASLIILVCGWAHSLDSWTCTARTCSRCASRASRRPPSAASVR